MISVTRDVQVLGVFHGHGAMACKPRGLDGTHGFLATARHDDGISPRTEVAFPTT